MAKPKDPVPLQRLGAIFMSMRDYRSAADAYRAAAALDPNNGNLHRELATALLVMGDAQNAMIEIRAALAKQADDPRLYNLLGVAQDMAGRHNLAQQTYRHGSEIAPTNVGLHNNYAMSLAMAGDFADAVTELGQIAKPDAPPRYNSLNLALAYGLAGDDVHAAEAARQVLDEASVQNNLSYYALLRGMDETHRTAAIIGAELHGTPVVADAALKTGTAVAEAKPVAPPTPAPVTTASLPPLLPEAALAPQADAASKSRQAAAVDAVPVAAAPQAAEAPKPAAPRHVAALADRPAPAPAPIAEKASAPAPSPHPAKDATASAPPAPLPQPAPDATASASPAPQPAPVATAEAASKPPVSLVPAPPSASPEPGRTLLPLPPPSRRPFSPPRPTKRAIRRRPPTSRRPLPRKKARPLPIHRARSDRLPPPRPTTASQRPPLLPPTSPWMRRSMRG